MFCQQCGAENRINAKFCAHCGAAIESQTKSTTSNQIAKLKSVEAARSSYRTDSKGDETSENHSTPSPAVPEESPSQFEPIKFCPECGKKLVFEKIKFCPYCGTKIPMIV
jgi:uncharacterized membrane protein YvbJ